MRKELNEQDQIQLKRLYNKAFKICHSKIIRDDLKEKANEMMKSLNEAYTRNNIEAVEKIFYKLKKIKKKKIKAKILKTKFFNTILPIIPIFIIMAIMFLASLNSHILIN
jgi:hypothetical protein